MFVINPYLRFALMAVTIVGGIILSVAYGFWYGFPFILVGVVLLAGYLFLGTVGPAAKKVQAQDFDAAEKLLNLTLSPKILYSANRAFYYMMRGSIALARKEIKEGEAYLKQAEAIDIPTPNEKAMLQLQLAQIAVSQQRWTQAQLHMKNLKEIKVSEPMVKEQIAQLDQVVKNRGQIRAAQRMGRQGHQMMQRGGKRRRPKMR